jgi:Lrp/AsnC family leucine-responsive transcriptional regulator
VGSYVRNQQIPYAELKTMATDGCVIPGLDDLDKKILGALQKNAKATMKEIADATGVSKNTVTAHIQKLESSAFIKGYYTILDCSKMGYREAILASLRLNSTLSLAGIKEKIDAMPEIKFAYITTGDYPVFVMAKCLGHEHAMRLIEQLRNLPGVEEVKTQMVLDRIKEDPTVIIP